MSLKFRKNIVLIVIFFKKLSKFSNLHKNLNNFGDFLKCLDFSKIYRNFLVFYYVFEFS